MQGGATTAPRDAMAHCMSRTFVCNMGFLRLLQHDGRTCCGCEFERAQPDVRRIRKSQHRRSCAESYTAILSTHERTSALELTVEDIQGFIAFDHPHVGSLPNFEEVASLFDQKMDVDNFNFLQAPTTQPFACLACIAAAGGRLVRS
jgi:hypothetical protein